jgi:hypothetical protein
VTGILCLPRSRRRAGRAGEKLVANDGDGNGQQFEKMGKWTFGKKQKAPSRHAPIENNPAKSTVYQPPEPQPLTEKSDNLGLSAGRYADTFPSQQPPKSNRHGAQHNDNVNPRGIPQGVSGGKQKKGDVDNVEAHDSGKEVSDGLKSSNGPAKLQRRKRESRDNVPSYYYQRNTGSRESLQRHALAEPPTLRPKMSEPEAVARRQSSKRRRRDPNREEEIKHMSTAVPPIPRRPATFSGGVLERDSRKIRGPLNRNLQRPLSEVSLPLAESMRSSLSIDSEPAPIRIRSLDVLSPHPTIRYNESPRLSGIRNSSWDPTRIGSSRDKRPPDIPEETLQQSRTVDELADDLDAGTLRELMDRDHRRKEKRRKSERERAQRRLERKAERQRLEQEALQRGGLEKSAVQDLDRGVLGRESGEKTSSTALEAGKRRRSHESLQRSRKNSKASSVEDFRPINPFLDRGEDSAAAAGDPTSADEHEEAVVKTAQAVRLSSASMSPPLSPMRHTRGTSNVSHLPELPSTSAQDVPENRELDRRASLPNTKRRSTSSWTGFFRRSIPAKPGSGEQDRKTPSEFSSSRDSLPKPQPRPVPLYKTTRKKAGAPVRTASKFREHLPEYPTPPDSRVQSPIGDQDTIMEDANPGLQIAPVFASSVARDPFLESKDDEHRSTQAPSPEGAASTVVAQSLASIDSEASWLGGRNAAKRSSPSGINPFRASTSSLGHRLDGEDGEPYVAQLSPRPDRSTNQRTSTGTVRAMSESDDGTIEEPARTSEQHTWHDAVARQPTVIHREGTDTSREGLWNEYSPDYDSETSPAIGSPDGETPPIVGHRGEAAEQKAESVALTGKHARHMSAGSAKLLDVSRRASAEPKL